MENTDGLNQIGSLSMHGEVLCARGLRSVQWVGSGAGVKMTLASVTDSTLRRE